MKTDVTPTSDPLPKGEALSLTIDGMDCPSCARKIEGAVAALPGTENVRVNHAARRITLELHRGETLAEDVARVIRKLGYGVQEAGKHTPHGDTPAWWQSAKGRLLLVTGALLAVAALFSLILPQAAPYLFSAAALLALFPLARKAVAAAATGQPFTIETLVSVAVVGAIVIGEAAEAAVVVFLFAVGELLESLAAMRARRSVQALADLMPKTARLITKDGIREVPAESLTVGDVIEIRPGDRIAADGIIEAGESAVDESPVTGESVPVEKAPGESVFAGSVNGDGVLRLRVTRPQADNMISRILHLVEEAEASKAPTARFIDRFSRYYTPGVMVVATLIAVLPPLVTGAPWLPWVYKGLAILLIGCPCALVLSTPAAITSGIASGARRGLLVKGGAVLEAIGRVHRIAFDKTGTLTEGRPQVTDVLPLAEGVTSEQVLRVAAAVESASSHPLAQAILAAAHAQGIAYEPAADVEAVRGKGVLGRLDGERIYVASPRWAESLAPQAAQWETPIAELEAQGKTVVLILKGGETWGRETGQDGQDVQLLGLIALRDELRSDARAAIGELDALAVRALMLTGDNARTGMALAKELGIEAKTELLPEDKLRLIETLRKDGPIAMVGDGINDAPALARADVGIAMGGGTDVALETADAALLHERVRDVPALVRLSRATLRNIHQNITFALGLKAVFLITTLFGVTSLWMAILADTGATVLVTLNALRLLALDPHRTGRW